MARAQTQLSADERIHAAICEAILRRKLAPGTKLQEIALGQLFKVSRTIVRRALQKLAHEGIVSLRAKRVAVVARPSIADVAHIFQARRAIEATVVSLVTMHGDRAGLASLAALVKEEEATYRRGDRLRGIRLSLAFHDRLAELSGNPVLAGYLRELVLRTSLIIALYERPGVQDAHADHLALIRAIGERDERRATRLMTKHLTELERALHVDASAGAAALRSIFADDANVTAALAGIHIGRRRRVA
jgi:DNA-binding GntR family transcriptional regulator